MLFRASLSGLKLFPLEAEAGLMNLISWLLAISFGRLYAFMRAGLSRTELCVPQDGELSHRNDGSYL